MNVNNFNKFDSRSIGENFYQKKENKVNLLIISILNEFNIRNKYDLMFKIDDILQALKERNISINTIGKREFKVHLIAALKLFSKHNENCQNIHLSIQDVKDIMNREKILLSVDKEYYVLKVNENEIYGLSQKELWDIQKKSIWDQSPEEQLILSMLENPLEHPGVEIIKYSEVVRLKQNYDQLATAQKNIETRSEQIHHLLADPSKKCIKVNNLIIGSGFAGEQLWRTKFKDRHQSVDNSLAQGKLPDSLMITEREEFGNWRRGVNYTFAQPHSSIEQPGRVNPADFTTEATYEHNKYVISRHLNQAIRINLDNNQAPVCFGTECLKIEARPKYPGSNWLDSSAAVRAKIEIVLNENETVDKFDAVIPDYHDVPEGQAFMRYVEKIDPDTGLQEVKNGHPVYLLEMVINKTIYADSIDICSGLGQPQSLLFYYKSALDKDTYQRLSQYDPIKKLTRIMDSNTAILTNRLRNELKTNPNTHTLVIGTGGNAAATAAELLKYKQSMTWLVRDNLNVAGHGSYVHDMIKKTEAQDAFAAGSILKIEEKNGKLEVLIRMNAAKNIKYYNEKIPQGKKLPKRQTFDLAQLGGGQQHEIVEVIRLPVDRIIYALGQNDEKTANMLRGIPLEALEEPSPMKGTPNVVVGVKSKDNTIHLWGAAAVGAGVTRGVLTSRGKPVVDTIREQLKEEHFTDNAGVGTMNPTVEHMRLAAGKTPDLSSINVNVTSRDLMIEFFKSAGIDEGTSSLLARDIWKARERTPQKDRAEVLQKDELIKILSRYSSMDVPKKVMIAGHTHLVKV